MRLVPRDLHRGDGTEVQAVDQRRLEQGGAERCVLSDGGDHQGRADLAEHVRLCSLHHARIREQEFTVGERVGEGVAQHDGRSHIHGPLETGLARAVPILGCNFHGARASQPFLDGGVNGVGHSRIGEGGEFGGFVLRGQGRERSELLGKRIGNFSGVSGHDHRRGVDATAAAVVGNRGRHQVYELRPALDLVLADEDLAEARAVHLDGRVVGVLRRGAFVAEDQSPAAAAQDLRGAFMVGWIEPERLRRTAGRDEGLDDPVGRPGLFPARLQDHGYLQGNGRQPKRIHPGRIARHNQPETRGCGVEANPRARLFAQAAIEDSEVEATRQAVQNGPHLPQSRGDLLHVPPHHDKGQTACRGEGLDILLGRLRVALVAQGQRLVQEKARSLMADFQQSITGELHECGARLTDARQVLADDTRVDLAEPR